MISCTVLTVVFKSVINWEMATFIKVLSRVIMNAAREINKRGIHVTSVISFSSIEVNLHILYYTLWKEYFKYFFNELNILEKVVNK